MEIAPVLQKILMVLTGSLTFVIITAFPRKRFCNIQEKEDAGNNVYSGNAKKLSLIKTKD
ncbi:MAG: hypothetical protein WCJ01_05630 [Ignavibacteria bacterium]